MAELVLYNFYSLFLLTITGFPIVAGFLYTHLNYKKTFRKLLLIFLFFLTYNLLFLLGFSIAGDYMDYFIHSATYFVFCLIIFMLFKVKHLYIRIIAILGSIVISLLFIVGAIGIMTFSLMADIGRDYTPDKIYHFTSNNKTYETRRFCYGFATTPGDRYTFVTYRKYSYLPFEKKIDRTIILDWNTDLILNAHEPDIDIEISKNEDQIVFRSINGHFLSKPIN